MVAKKELKEGGSAPFFKVKDHNQSILKLNQNGKKFILIFNKSSCSICESLLNNLGLFPFSKSDKVEYIFIGDNLINNIPYKFKQLSNVHFVEDLKLVQTFEIEVIPYLIIINESLVIELMKQIIEPKEVFRYLDENGDELIS